MTQASSPASRVKMFWLILLESALSKRGGLTQIEFEKLVKHSDLVVQELIDLINQHVGTSKPEPKDG